MRVQHRWSTARCRDNRPAFFRRNSRCPVSLPARCIMFSSMQVLQKYEGKNITLKRLRRQQILGALMLLLAGGLMACSVYGIPPLCKGEWQVALAIGAILEVYTAFRIPAELAREKR